MKKLGEKDVMKTKMTAATITMLFLVGILSMAFNAQATFVQGEIATVPLWTWSDATNVGTVTLTIEGEILIVTLRTTDGWLMHLTHLYIELMPPPWSFPFPLDDPLFSEYDLGGANSIHIPVSLEDWVECGDTIYIVTHTHVINDGFERDAWGQEDPLEIGWKKYFSVIIPCAPERGKITGGGHGDIGANGIPGGSFGFNVMWFSKDPGPKGELEYVDHTTGMNVHAHDIDYLVVWEELVGNKPWPMRKGIFGGPCTIDHEEGFYFDVYIEDNGEPGKNDVFQITLSTGYVGGSDVEPILCGNIQIHKPPK